MGDSLSYLDNLLSAVKSCMSDCHFWSEFCLCFKLPLFNSVKAGLKFVGAATIEPFKLDIFRKDIGIELVKNSRLFLK